MIPRLVVASKNRDKITEIIFHVLWIFPQPSQLVTVESQLHTEQAVDFLQHFLRTRSFCILAIAQTLEVGIQAVFAAGKLVLEIFFCGVDQRFDSAQVMRVFRVDGTGD